MNERLFGFLSLIILVSMNLSCAKKDQAKGGESKPVENRCDSLDCQNPLADKAAAETLAGSIASAAAQGDSSGSVVAFGAPYQPKASFFQIAQSSMKNWILPQAIADVLPPFCSNYSPSKIIGQTCNGNKMNLHFDCRGPLGLITWSGNVTLTFSSSQLCSAVSAGGIAALSGGASVTATSPAGLKGTAVNGFKVIVDSSSSGFALPKQGGTKLTLIDVDVSTGTLLRSVEILGVHRVLEDPLDKIIADHTVDTPNSLQISGLGASKVISSGSVRVQHNLAQITSTATVANPLTFSANCCHPTGGSVNIVSTSASGTQNAQMTFGPACGTAQLDGQPIVLVHCQ